MGPRTRRASVFSEFRVLLQPEITRQTDYTLGWYCASRLCRVKLREDARQVHQRYACLLAQPLEDGGRQRMLRRVRTGIEPVGRLAWIRGACSLAHWRDTGRSACGSSGWAMIRSARRQSSASERSRRRLACPRPRARALRCRSRIQWEMQ